MASNQSARKQLKELEGVCAHLLIDRPAKIRLKQEKAEYFRKREMDTLEGNMKMACMIKKSEASLKYAVVKKLQTRLDDYKKKAPTLLPLIEENRTHMRSTIVHIRRRFPDEDRTKTRQSLSKALKIMDNQQKRLMLEKRIEEFETSAK